MSDNRLDWFRCHQSKLLGALAGLPSDEQLIYVTVLLRIYEVNGPCPDDARTLSLRTHMPTRRVTAALDGLTGGTKPKLLRVEGGLMNGFAQAELDERVSVLQSLKEGGKKGASRRWEKTKGKQRNGDSLPMADLKTLQVDSESEIEKNLSAKAERTPSPSRAKERGRHLIPKDWKPKPEHYVLGAEHGLTDREVDDGFAEMRSWSLGNGEKRTDWDRVFDNWLRRNAQRKGKMHGRGSYGSTQNADHLADAGAPGGQGRAPAGARGGTRDDAILAGMGRIADRVARNRQHREGGGSLFDEGPADADRREPGDLAAPRR